MARYKVAHFPATRTWIVKTDSGFEWKECDDSSEAHLFSNYKEAKSALDSLPDEIFSYGESYRNKCLFIKFYDSDEHFEKEMTYLEKKRLFKEWGY